MDAYAVIDRLIIGDDYDIRRTVTEIPEGAELVECTLLIKIEREDADSDAVITKVITDTEETGIGQILNSGSSTGEADIIFQLTRAETELLYPVIAYAYSIKVLTDTDKVHAAERGLLYPLRGIRS